MNPETLDRLLLDRALGELPRDVLELLDAYLEREPGAAERGRQFASATDLARQVLAADRPAALPAFPHAWLQSAARMRRRLVLVRNVAGLAACVLLGVGLGTSLTRITSASKVPDATTGQLVPAPEQVGGAPATISFWSIDRLRHAADNPRPAPPTEWKWNSPLTTPKQRGAT